MQVSGLRCFFFSLSCIQEFCLLHAIKHDNEHNPLRAFSPSLLPPCKIFLFSFSPPLTSSFHRLVDTGDIIQDRKLRENQFVLAAVGSLKESSNGNKSLMLKHLRYTASSCACDVLSCDEACSCPMGFFYQMLKLHGECPPSLPHTHTQLV